MSIDQFRVRYGVGRTTAYEEIKLGRLRAHPTSYFADVREDANVIAKHIPASGGARERQSGPRRNTMNIQSQYTLEISRLKLANFVRNNVRSKTGHSSEIKWIRYVLGSSLENATRLVNAALADPLLVEIEKIEAEASDKGFLRAMRELSRIH
jgi:hypothetical protein